MPKSMTKSNLLFAILCLTSSFLSGCGTKGPLYIPEQRYPQQAFEQMYKPSLAQISHTVVVQKPTIKKPIVN